MKIFGTEIPTGGTIRDAVKSGVASAKREYVGKLVVLGVALYVLSRRR